MNPDGKKSDTRTETDPLYGCAIQVTKLYNWIMGYEARYANEGIYYKEESEPPYGKGKEIWYDNEDYYSRDEMIIYVASNALVVAAEVALVVTEVALVAAHLLLYES